MRASESQGIPTTDDLQDLVTGHGAEHWLKWINRDTGRRSDSAHGYIHSTRAVHQNLHLAVNTKVDKIIMEGGRAVGVKTIPTKPLSPAQNHSRTFRARKQIVVSGGTLSSPLILQRSGIGNPEKLRKAGVKPLIDLPGVGLNFQDHYLVRNLAQPTPAGATLAQSFTSAPSILSPKNTMLTLPDILRLPRQTRRRIFRRLRARRPRGPKARLRPMEHQRHRSSGDQRHRGRCQGSTHRGRAEHDGLLAVPRVQIRLGQLLQGEA